jgi:hypothetical protein
MNKIAKGTYVLGVLGAVLAGGAFAVLTSACVDGTTPDCTSPDAGCNPSAPEDASADGDATTASDGATDGAADSAADTGTDTSTSDDGGDAAGDGPSD